VPTRHGGRGSGTLTTWPRRSSRAGGGTPPSRPVRRGRGRPRGAGGQLGVAGKLTADKQDGGPRAGAGGLADSALERGRCGPLVEARNAPRHLPEGYSGTFGAAARRSPRSPGSGKTGHPGTGTRLTGLGAAVAPGSDPCQDAPGERGTAAVVLAGVLVAGRMSGAHGVVCGEVGAVRAATGAAVARAAVRLARWSPDMSLLVGGAGGGRAGGGWSTGRSTCRSGDAERGGRPRVPGRAAHP
jgi:hypothetical protein